ncbi:MAG: hypothetical protein MUF83_02820 [Acidimicrobiales bacterium]|jgi:hypothetical protein|nr:hypothetical protein [Acidimicrobiales bacterium]
MPHDSIQPDGLREWVSFDVDGATYSFDLTFLTSPWTCIYGRGCPGIADEPAPELVHGCCTHGAHFIDKADRRRVEEKAAQLTGKQWQLRKRAEKLGGPIERTEDGDVVTRTWDDACIFLNRVGAPTGPGCALHQAALAAGERPLDWKPAVCWQVPLRLDSHVDDNGHATYWLREWQRRDWGEGGQEFHWWCTEAGEAFVGGRAVVDEMREEIIEMVGEAPYARLLDYLATRADEQFVEHPALKQRPRQPSEVVP